MKPLSSMTGSANLKGQTNAGQSTIDIKSVNSRFLEIAVRLPEELRSFDSLIRETISKRFSRGKIECKATLNTQTQEGSLDINEKLVGELSALSERIRSITGAAPLTANDILNFPGVLVIPTPDEEEFKKQFQDCLNGCLDLFEQARQREGDALRNILLEQCDKIDELVNTLEPKLPLILEALKEKLQERLSEALADALSENSSLTKEDINDRIRQELTLFGMKMDVAEEIGRLRTHVKEVRRVLDNGGAVGRRLDFLMQELNREANTLGSKTVAIEMTDTSVNLKVAIEAMREQIQNLE